MSSARQHLKLAADRLDFLLDETFRIEDAAELQRLVRAIASDTLRDLATALEALEREVRL